MTLHNGKIISEIKIVFEKTMLRGIEDNTNIVNVNDFNVLFERAYTAALEQVSYFCCSFDASLQIFIY